MTTGTLAIVQARMGSARLPGKVLRPIHGRPLLWHILYRLRKCRRIDTIVVATSTESQDDDIEAFCCEADVPVVRGSEKNVLARFNLAVQKFDPSLIVRVNADAPLIDPVFIDTLIRTVTKQDADIAFGPPGVPCLHGGVDPISRRAFDRLITKAGNDPVAQEHVTGYLKKHPGFGKIARIDIEPALQFGDARLSIDTQADIDFIEMLYALSNAEVGELNIRDVSALLQMQPELRKINAHVQQKSLDHRGGTVVMRCDGGHDIGFGHVTRSLAVARVLRDTHGFGVVFAMAADAAANARVSSEGFKVETWAGGRDEEAWLEKVFGNHAPVAVVYDIRTGLSPSAVRRLKTPRQLTVMLDDGSPRRLEADIVAYPPVQQVYDLDWIGFGGTKLIGWEWVILPNAVRERSAPKPSSGCSGLLVSMGGSDPLNLTWDVACRLKDSEAEIDPIFVIGPGFVMPDLLNKRLRSLFPEARIAVKPSSLADLFEQAGLAITMYGVTAQELAAAGVPALYLCLDEDHCFSARSLAERGVGITLGLADEVDWPSVMAKIEQLLVDGDELALMAKRGPRLIDGQGAERLAALISKKIEVRVAA